MTPPRRRPSRLTLAGVVETGALWFDSGFLGETEVRRRIHAVWRTGATVWRAADGLLVRFPSPIRIDTRAAPGSPTVRIGGRTSTLPLHPHDLADTPDDAFLTLRGGSLVVAGPTERVRVDPASWVDLGALAPVPVVPLGDPPAPPAIALAPITTDVRARHGIAGDGAIAVTGLADALKRILPLGGPPAALAAAGARALTGAAGLLARAGGWFPRNEGGPPGLVSRWAQRLDAWGRALGLDAMLGSLIGEQHSRYLANMVSLFDGGNWLEALRHAIPLSGVPADPSVGGAWLRWLSPRGGLGFSGAGGPGGGGVTTDGGLFAYLKQMYRRAFEALDAQGRVKEAAYVLGELLGEHHEAVTYLEAHDEHRLAAELAETKELDPGLVVLLWLRAGDRRRAAVLARLRGGWAAAVEGLERRNLVREAHVLRMEWATIEAFAGRHAAAVAIAWVVPELRERAAPWLDPAIAAGGIGGARALARKVQLAPGRRDEVVDAVDRILDDQTLGAEHVRRELAAELATNPDPPSARLLVPVARALIRDAVRSPSPERERRAREAAKDGTLAADLPRIPTVRERAGGMSTFGVPEADTGTMRIHDVVLLPRGHLLLALGEIGARLVGPDGRTRTHWSFPTHRLIPNPLGTRVILVCHRGPVWRLARLDTVTGKLAPWCEAALDLCAPTYDGQTWFVAEGDRVTALDTAADDLRALWSVTGLGEGRGPWNTSTPVLALAVEERALFVVCPADDQVEWFRYELPGPTLRERRRLVAPPGLRGVAAATTRGVLAVGPERLVQLGTPDVVRTLEGDVVTGWSAGDLDACAVLDRGLARIELWKIGAGSPTARFLFPGATRVSTRLDPIGGTVTVWDDLGRVRVLDLEDDTLRIDVRC